MATTQAEMDAALNAIKNYFFQQGMSTVWDQVKSKIEDKLGISIITQSGDVLQFLPNGNPAQKLADFTAGMLTALYYYANQLVNPTTNPFHPKEQLEDYVKFLLYTWATNDAKVGPAYKWDTTDLKALGKTLRN
jgi:hypothetical protein